MPDPDTQAAVRELVRRLRNDPAFQRLGLDPEQVLSMSPAELRRALQSAPAPALTAEEAYRVERWTEAFGMKETSAPMIAARAAWAKDPQGGAVTVDPFKVLLLKNLAAGAPRLGARR